MKPAGPVVAAHAENGTDAGEGRATVQKIIDQRAERDGDGGLDVPKPHRGEAKSFCAFVCAGLHAGILRFFGQVLLRFKVYHKQQEMERPFAHFVIFSRTLHKTPAEDEPAALSGL